MNKSAKTLECKFDRTIPAPPNEVFDGWLNPKIPGNPWNAAEKFMLDPEVDGLVDCPLKGRPITEDSRRSSLRVEFQHTWVSPNTLGEESTVTVSFEKQGEDTLMTLVHSDLPHHEARRHEKGWNYFLEMFREQFGNGSPKQYRWDDAHAPVKK
jgi:uncharacterized protein YndB with AHSA1/START domain